MLSRYEKKIIAACANTLFPPGGPIPISGSEAGLVPYIDAYLASLPPLSRILGRLLFLFVQLSPWVFGPRRASFTNLDRKERIQTIQAMSVSDTYFRRVAYLSMRAMMTFGYFAHPRVVLCITRTRANEVTP